MDDRQESALAEWVRKQMQRRNWTQVELAAAAEVSRSSIQRALDAYEHGSPANWNVIAAIADAFQMPREVPLRIAGLLDPAPQQTYRVAELNSMFTRLPETVQDDVLAYVEWRATR